VYFHGVESEARRRGEGEKRKEPPFLSVKVPGPQLVDRRTTTFRVEVVNGSGLKRKRRGRKKSAKLSTIPEVLQVTKRREGKEGGGGNWLFMRALLRLLPFNLVQTEKEEKEKKGGKRRPGLCRSQ